MDICLTIELDGDIAHVDEQTVLDLATEEIISRIEDGPIIVSPECFDIILTTRITLED